MKLKIKKLEKIKITKIDILLFFYIVTFSVRMLTNLDFNLTTLLWFASGALIFAYEFASYPRYRSNLVILLLIDSIALLNLAMNGNRSFFNAFILVSTQAFGILMYQYRERLKVVEVSSFVLIIYLVFKVVTTPKVLVSSWQYGIILTNLVGQNTVSILLIMFLSFHVIYRLETKQEFKYIFFILSMIAVFICDGMGGILALSVYVAGLWILNRRKNRLSIRKIWILLFGFALVISLKGAWQQIIHEIMDDNSRFWIWSHYGMCVDSIKSFIIGARVDRFEFLFRQKNMHNTFINWHYYYGLIPTVFFLGVVIKDIFYCIKHKNHTLLLVLGVTLLRAMTDETSFSFMPIWTYIWIQSCMEKRKGNV